MNTLFISYLKKYKDISCYTYPFPTGRLYLFGNNDSIKLVQFGFSIEHKKQIEKSFKSGLNDELEKAIDFLDKYLIGEEGELPELDLSSYTEKERQVYKNLINVRFGQTVSYKQLSELAGIKNGARFIGSTMARNFFPLLIPCHRVINSNGSIGNYSPGREVKKYLLQHERVLRSN